MDENKIFRDLKNLAMRINTINRENRKNPRFHDKEITNIFIEGARIMGVLLNENHKLKESRKG